MMRLEYVAYRRRGPVLAFVSLLVAIGGRGEWRHALLGWAGYTLGFCMHFYSFFSDSNPDVLVMQSRL